MKKLILLLTGLLWLSCAFGQNRVAGYVYWFNQEFAGRSTQLITGSSNYNLQNDFHTSGLYYGINVFHIQFFDDSLRYSVPVSKTFYKTKYYSSVTNKITAYRYWFNDDFANVATQSIPPANQQNIVAQINPDSLFPGLNTLNIQIKDEYGLWSSAISSFFLNSESGINNKMVSYQYWFDDDFHQSVTVNFQPPAGTVHQIAEIDLTNKPKGDYIFNMRMKDSMGLWSAVVSDTISKQAFPIARFEADTILICPGGAITFTNTSIDADIFIWDFGDGNGSGLVNPVHIYHQTGSYMVSLFAKDSSSGKDSTYQMAVTVLPSYQIDTIIDICDGESINWRGTIYQQSGTYYDSLQT
ncbi:MAG: PKD domain-containing protein, partial [Bacteroidota bacterium]